jgi:hypothetical protein
MITLDTKCQSWGRVEVLRIFERGRVSQVITREGEGGGIAYSYSLSGLIELVEEDGVEAFAFSLMVVIDLMWGRCFV